jgi:hypothetical protein
MLMEKNETFLLQIINSYDECQNPAEKLNFLKGNVSKLALT